MNAWNCCRLSRGPSPNVHSIGRTSRATKSESAILPTSLNTSNAAIMTAGSFVLMAFINGTTFSWIVYLSSMAALLCFALAFALRPSRSSFWALIPPPHKVWNASKPLILMPMLLVFAKTEAMTGKSSFLIVEKSSTVRMNGRVLKDASTKE